MGESRLAGLVDMDNPKSVLNEAIKISSLMYPDFEFEALERAFNDIESLFNGKYPGYKKCNTEFHNLKHTTDTFLAMARLMHGAFVAGNKLPPGDVKIGLICALMHDTGYIQTDEDDVGTGGKYTLMHIGRSIIFMDKYIFDNGIFREDFKNFSNILYCTGMDTKINEIRFESPEVKLLCKMLGTADLLGQMADRTYLEKLLFLFYEFSEGDVVGYESELDLLKKTKNFYALTLKRFSGELGEVYKYMRNHFQARWGIDRDLYLEAIEKNINYLQYVLKNHRDEYRKFFKRGEFVAKLKERDL